MGSVEAFDPSGELFPHIKGGIPVKAVLEEVGITRSDDGSFLSIPGITSTRSSLQSVETVESNAKGFPPVKESFSSGVALGLTSGFVLGAAVACVCLQRHNFGK